MSKQYHEKHMQQYQLTQQNLNQIKTEKLQHHLYVEEYMIYYVAALYIMYSNQKSYLDFHDWIEHSTCYI